MKRLHWHQRATNVWLCIHGVAVFKGFFIYKMCVCYALIGANIRSDIYWAPKDIKTLGRF